jgi:HSP20 family molecular chaperone IbpA
MTSAFIKACNDSNQGGIMNHFYTHFNEFFNQLDTYGYPADQLQTKKTCNVPSYPHSNVYMTNDTNELHMEFALAGYSEDKVSVTAGGHNITVVASVPNSNVTILDEITIHNGISRKDVNFTMSVDEAFDVKKAQVKFTKGILSIVIPKLKEQETIKLL